MKKKVKGNWFTEIYLDAMCPYCNASIDPDALEINSICDGDKIVDETVKCHKCKKLYILNVDAI